MSVVMFSLRMHSMGGSVLLHTCPSAGAPTSMLTLARGHNTRHWIKLACFKQILLSGREQPGGHLL
eukprot:4874895-Amphidinium_carterae.1